MAFNPSRIYNQLEDVLFADSSMLPDYQFSKALLLLWAVGSPHFDTIRLRAVVAKLRFR